MSHRRAVVVALAVVLGGCGVGRAHRESTARFAANGVLVTVVLAAAADDRRELRATFTPQQPGFHVYSVDLPTGGVAGLGIPTRVAVTGDLTAVGQPTANAATRIIRPAGLGVDLPVYPDGPVTITLAVRQTGARHAEVVVSYGACGESRCLMPVIDRAIQVSLD